MKGDDSNITQVNWRTGTWRHPRGGQPSAEILIAGDWAPIRGFSDLILDDPAAVYGDLLPLIRAADLRVTNLESPLADGGVPAHKSGAVFKGVAGHVHGLTAVPFDVVTLANNHVFDYGIGAFERTRALLDENGIRYTGGGLNLNEAKAPLQVSVNGVRIGLVSFSEGEDLTAAEDDKPGVFGWEVDRVVELVVALRSEVEAVIVICHGGVEYIPFPPPYLAEALQRIAAAGADLVIGHHPHVPQGVHIYGRVPICYSLGNFVFFQPTDLQYRKIGYLVKAGIGARGVEAIQIVPYEIGSAGLSRLTGEKRRRAYQMMAGLSSPLDRSDGIAQAWHGFLKHYGVKGFQAEIVAIMEKLETERPKGAAMFRNRLTTLQHYYHLRDLMTHIVEGTLDGAPEWAVEWVADFFSRKVSDGLPG